MQGKSEITACLREIGVFFQDFGPSRISVLRPSSSGHDVMTVIEEPRQRRQLVFLDLWSSAHYFKDGEGPTPDLLRYALEDGGNRICGGWSIRDAGGSKSLVYSITLLTSGDRFVPDPDQFVMAIAGITESVAAM